VWWALLSPGAADPQAIRSQALPAIVGEQTLCDSRCANGQTVNRSGAFTIQWPAAGWDSFEGWQQLTSWNFALFTPGGMFGSGGTTTAHGAAVMKFSYTDASAAYNNGASATLGAACETTAPNYCSNIQGAHPGFNGAYARTGRASDGKWSDNALGTTSPVTDPGNLVLLVEGVNDAGSRYFTSRYPLAIGTIDNLITIFNDYAAANDVVLLANDTPHGPSKMAWMEPCVVTANTCGVAHVQGWLEGSSFGETPVVDSLGNVLTAVTGAPAAGQYSASAGVYTFAPGVNSPVYVTYAYQGSYGSYLVSQGPDGRRMVSFVRRPATAPTSAYDLVVHAYLSDVSGDFTYAGKSYGVPGACNAVAWPGHLCADIWDALSGAPDTYRTGYSFDGLHPSGAGSIAAAKAFLTALQTAYPDAGTKAGSTAGAPVSNNWYAAEGLANASTYGSGITVGGYAPSTLPGVMTGSACESAAAAGSLQIWVNGVENAVASGGAWSGVGAFAGRVRGTYSCTTGAWSATWSSSRPAGGAVIAIKEDPANLLLNGMMDGAQKTPIVPATVSGLTPPYGWVLDVTANLSSALANGPCAGQAPPCGAASLTPTTVTDLDGTWPGYRLTFTGTLAGTATLKLTNPVATASGLIPVGSRLRATGYSAIGPLGGHLFGLYGVQADLGVNVASGVFQPYAAYPNVHGLASTTSLNCVGAVGSSAYPFSDLMLSTWRANFASYGPMILQPTVSHLCDTTGMPGIGSTRMDYQVELSAGPNAFTAILYRAGLFIRSR
jgi:hypothetical protein